MTDERAPSVSLAELRGRIESLVGLSKLPELQRAWCDFTDTLDADLATAPAEPPKDRELDSDHPILKRAQELRVALIACVAVTKAWHGKDAWGIYYNHSPEMKPIRDVLGPCPVPQPNER